VDELRRVQEAVEEVYIDPLLQHWLIRLVRATRELEAVTVGASVRGSLALERAARAWALTQGRPFVQPEDVEQLFVPVLGHRILLNPYRLEESGNAGPLDLLGSCLERAPRPGIAT
jgi:MoxR-like ATPase